MRLFSASIICLKNLELPTFEDGGSSFLHYEMKCLGVGWCMMVIVWSGVANINFSHKNRLVWI